MLDEEKNENTLDEVESEENNETTTEEVADSTTEEKADEPNAESQKVVAEEAPNDAPQEAPQDPQPQNYYNPYYPQYTQNPYGYQQNNQQGYYQQVNQYGQPYPQQMPYNPQNGQPYPQQMPYNPQNGQPYPQQMPYNPQNGQPYPQPPMPPQPPMYQQAQPQKKKMKGGTKFFIFVMVFLFAFGGGAFGYSIFSESKKIGTQPKEDSSFGQTLPEIESTPEPDENSDGSSEDSDGNSDSEDSEDSESSALTQPDIKVVPNTDGITINKKPSGDELSAEEVYAKVLPSTVTVEAQIADANGDYSESYGTGIFLTEDGYIITNSHVVNNTKSSIVTIITSDSQEHECVIVGFDKTTDIAILKIDGTGYTPAEFGDASELSIGEWVIAIGNPGGTSFTGSLTRGVISGLDRSVGSYSSNGMTYIQTDAAINPGNSGGPLVNMYGQVVGINSSKIVADYYEGMGFAIPVSKAKDIIDELLSSGYVSGRVRLGIKGKNYYDLTITGVEIVEISEGSGFEGTDAKVGDIITAVDGNEVDSLTSLSNELLSYSPGDTCEVTLVHPADGSEYKVTITLLADEGETQG